MSRKDLLSKLRNTEPLSLYWYKRAHKDVLGKSVWVPAKEVSHFKVLDDDLREYGIGPREYALSAMPMLESWLNDRKLSRVPVKVYTGDWILQRVLGIVTSEFVRLEHDDEYDVIFQEELKVARYYIEMRTTYSNSIVRFGDAVAELEPILSETWLEVWNKMMTRPVDAVLDVICEEYDVKQAITYDDVVDVINGR